MQIGLIGIVRPDKEPDCWQAVQRIADIGYKGIEGANFLLTGDVDKNIKRFHDMGMKVLCTSAKPDQLRDDLPTVIERAKQLQTDRISIWHWPCDSAANVKELTDLLNTAGAKVADAGLTLAYHHHAHEFENVFDGKSAFDQIVEETDPASVRLIVDIAWAAVGGQEPAAVIRRLGDRVVSLHIKDVYSTAERGCWTTVGTGVVDIAGTLKAAEEVGIAWGAVEQDQLRQLDAWETITASYLNLKELGFSNG